MNRITLYLLAVFCLQPAWSAVVVQKDHWVGASFVEQIKKPDNGNRGNGNGGNNGNSNPGSGSSRNPSSLYKWDLVQTGNLFELTIIPKKKTDTSTFINTVGNLDLYGVFNPNTIKSNSPKHTVITEMIQSDASPVSQGQSVLIEASGDSISELILTWEVDESMPLQYGDLSVRFQNASGEEFDATFKNAPIGMMTMVPEPGKTVAVVSLIVLAIALIRRRLTHSTH